MGHFRFPLKMFNSRTCQLILGAGALHLVGLKNINTKNLGLFLVFTGKVVYADLLIAVLYAAVSMQCITEVLS